MTIDRENSEVSQVPKKRGGGSNAFNINQADHKLVILATSLSLREHGSMREKKTHTTKYDDAIELC